MAQAFTSYIVDNDRKFRDSLKRAADASGDLRVPFGLILADFYRSEQAIFQLQGPGQYPPFKHSDANFRTGKNGKKRYEGTTLGGESPYQYYKKKKVGFDYPLLVRTGALAASLTAGGPRSIAVITSTRLTVGTQVAYGIYHQSDAPRKKIPLRKFLFIGPEALQFATSDQMGRPTRWMNIMNDWALKSARSSGVGK